VILTWPFDPTVYLGLVGLLLAYAWLARGRLDHDRRPLCFLVGLAVLWVALETPLDSIGEDYLGSVHMLQHMLLGMVAPPLLLLGLSPQMAALLTSKAPGLRIAVRPVVAQLAAGLVWVVWHLPALYDLTLSDLQVHILEHLLFVGAGLLLFWPLVASPAALSGGARMLYAGIATLPQDGVAIALQFAGFIFYAPYRVIPSIAPGYTALVDQTVSGAIMMLASNAVLGLLLLITFFHWLRHEESRQQTEDRDAEAFEELQAWAAHH
jgi:putative membrane protein